jgi:hypothetical protein
VAQRVIDLLKVVDIGQDDRHRLARPPAAREFALQPCQNFCTV